jgi:hypothetical protein
VKNCKRCNQSFEARAAGKEQLYCSPICYFLTRHEQTLQARRDAYKEKICDQCKKSFISNIKAQRFCCDECRRVATLIRLKEKWRTNNPLPANWNYDCDDCGKIVERDLEQGPVNKGRYGRFCLTCTKRRKVARYRKKTVRRQGIVKPGNIHYDEVFARDNGVCWLCDEAVDPALPRVSAGGGTIDHVIPISKGGEDTLENCRLAHWSCNNRKSNKLIEGLNA